MLFLSKKQLLGITFNCYFNSIKPPLNNALKEKKFVKEDLLKVVNNFLFQLFFHFRREARKRDEKSMNIHTFI